MLGREFGIALAHQGIEIRKDRSRDQKRIVLVEQICLVGSALAQQADHEFGRRQRPRIRIGMLPGGQTIVGTDEGSDEGGHGHAGAHGIHQTESHSLDERARLLDGADGLAIEPPLFAAELL